MQLNFKVRSFEQFLAFLDLKEATLFYQCSKAKKIIIQALTVETQFSKICGESQGFRAGVGKLFDLRATMGSKI